MPGKNGRAQRTDRQDGYLVVLRREKLTERLDERGLASTRRTCNADAECWQSPKFLLLRARLSSVSEHGVQEQLRLLLVTLERRLHCFEWGEIGKARARVSE